MMGRQRFLLLSILLLFTFVNADQVVHTESGPVRGRTVASGRVEAYLGIPYAEPPVGQLRFAKPVPKTPWTDVLDATEKPPPCIQLDLKLSFAAVDMSRMSEDCLQLNVWVPNSKTAGGTPKAVMFFIHGGAFMMGTASWEVHDGANLAELGDVVVVTINYRVGSLGFVAGNTEDAPGNQGLYDQILALRWVRDNAKHFNGDPDNIAIFGGSAGAFSVSLLQLSPVSGSLFRRAILQSGSAVNPLYTVENKAANHIDEMYARELGCVKADDAAVDNSPADILKCLRSLPADDFAKADMAAFRKGTKILFPRFGGELFPDDAVSMFQEGQFKHSEVLMGVTRDEGMVGFILADPTSLGRALGSSGKDPFNRTTAYAVLKDSPFSKMFLETMASEESEKIVQSYLDDVSDDSGHTHVKAVSDFWGDCLMTCGNLFQAEYQSAMGDPVYFYLFDYRTSNSPFPDWMGVPHGAELQYVFGNPMFQVFNEEEKELSQDIIHMWTNFAKTGNPNLPGGLQWPPFTSEDPKYLVIAGKDRVETRPDNHRCERWRSFFLKSIQ